MLREKRGEKALPEDEARRRLREGCERRWVSVREAPRAGRCGEEREEGNTTGRDESVGGEESQCQGLERASEGRGHTSDPASRPPAKKGESKKKMGRREGWGNYAQRV